MPLRLNPVIYEINTWVWLADLTVRFGHPITLANVPTEVLDELAAWDLDAIWMMGVWERSPRGRQVALEHPGLQYDYERALPGYTADQICGSPYAVHRYVVDDRLGGRDGLAAFRVQLRQRGIGLILDYVPNHVAVDHPWTVDQPDALVRGTPHDLETRASSFFKVPENGLIFAHGHDPYFPAWTDTVQVDAFSHAGREQALKVLLDIADQCDGLRCDMAMLVVNRIFAHTWARADIPPVEFWNVIIPPIKARNPGFLFMAEVYWDMEAELQALGFDFTYDKRLYDRLLHDDIHTVRDHLLAASSYQRKLVRFIENHDEARAVTAFGPGRSEAAAVVISALPGARLFHDGQFEGRKIKIPVQLGLRPAEPPVVELVSFYRHLTAALQSPVYHDGVFMALAAHPILGSDTGHEYLLAFAWALSEDWRLVVINYSDRAVEGRIMLPRPAFAGPGVWRFDDRLRPGEPILHTGDDLLTAGLPVRLDRYQAHMFAITKAAG